MNALSTIDLARISAMDREHAARLLKGVRDATLSGARPRVLPRPVIGESWVRMLTGGVDPDRGHRSSPLGEEELEQRRRASPLAEVLPVVRHALVSVADAAQHIMVVCDADGRVLWREGNAAVLHRADALGFAPGADWSEDVVGTNGVGTPLVVRRPVQVFSAEHFVRTQHAWTCTGAPVTDPRDGRLLGVIDVSGPLRTMHPATLALVDSVAKLAEARLREGHERSLNRLRAVAAPILSRLEGRALAVDVHGWTAAVTGMPPEDRLALPKSLMAGRSWLPALGVCRVEPLPGGWLLRPEAPGDEPEPPAAARLVLDVSGARRWTITALGGVRDWTHELSPRHAELLYVLSTHPKGRSASDLARDLFDDPARTVTVRAELSRVRRYLGALLEHRPYRFHEDVRVDVVLPDDPAALLPHSTAPAVCRARGVAGP
ncbi:diguanylate cyclase [Streptomyces alfalfae]|uniref:Diguanylate cyclase n=1 Tax=Streptomyces alfalfae TaxID=1642299 RepID=A0A1P8TDR0_9ACTN|nr:GAF domain-containing protein [Streptomyces alfalfae]AYA16093.1 GAF domain-containing protein [Streptomyces fradiae]APY85734.1 diguanylate cyclase [Streptomyces alfalfae]QQC92017.1 GAF domain-containing protein [Streptomyces alfalfae]QUI34536.1 GAF domain-containing protein [Streptomyces alfalfae]RXX39564.1 diguanylate cyclase [Streptomyces alfalfae]